MVVQLALYLEEKKLSFANLLRLVYRQLSNLGDGQLTSARSYPFPLFQKASRHGFHEDDRLVRNYELIKRCN